MSRDQATWAPFAFLAAGRDVDHGIAAGKLADTDCIHVWDEDNTVSIEMAKGSLASDSDLDVLNGANAFLLGGEVIQAVNAALESDGSYTLSRLLRGRRLTHEATDDHAARERFLVLSADTLLAVDMETEDIGATLYFKAVPLGGSLANAPVVTLAFAGNSLKPAPPTHLTGSREGSPSDWVFSWLRGDRLGAAWIDGMDIPMTESSESYEVRVLDISGSPEEVVNTYTAGAGETFSYTEAQQVSDWGAVQDTVTIDVAQISAVVGAGFRTQATFTT